MSVAACDPLPQDFMADQPRHPRTRITTNCNQLIGYYTEARIVEGGELDPCTPPSERDEYLRPAFAEGKLHASGQSEPEGIVANGDAAAPCEAITFSVAATRVAEFTGGQGTACRLEHDMAEARI